MTAVIETTQVETTDSLAPMPADLLPRYEQYLLLKAQKEQLDFQMNEIKEVFGERLKIEGLDGYTRFGKARVRRSEFNRHGIDTAALQAKHPRIYRAFLKATKVVSIRIS